MRDSSAPSTPSRLQKVAWLACLVVSLLLIVAVAAYAFWAPSFIESIYEQRSWPALNRLAHPDRHDLAHYLSKGRIVFTRVLLGILVITAGLLAWAYRQRLTAFLHRFLYAADWAVNLACFRIALFAALLYGLATEADVMLLFSRMPDELRVAPFGLGWLLPWLTFSSEGTSFLLIVATIVCVSGLVGFCARTSAGLAFVLALYLFGVPQCFGKIAHNSHYLIWFSALLAVSPCGDALSVDALWAARRGTALPRLGP
jgi:hypothetical protein